MSKPMARSSQDGQKRRPGRPSLSNDELLDKALALFLEHGFSGTSIESVTTSAGMAKRTIYSRFGDKANLFRAAIEHGIDNLNVAKADLQAVESRDLEDTLQAIASLLVENLSSRDGMRLMQLLQSESLAVPDISDDLRLRAMSLTQGYLADLFRLRLELTGAEEEDAMLYAELFMDSVVRGPVMMANQGQKLDRARLDYRTRKGVQVFLKGVEGIRAEAEQANVEAREVRQLLRVAEDRLDEARRTIAEAGRLARH